MYNILASTTNSIVAQDLIYFESLDEAILISQLLIDLDVTFHLFWDCSIHTIETGIIPYDSHIIIISN
jgi:hypothetical protein